MARPPFGTEPERSSCYRCGEVVSIPPGVYYRGEKLCRMCYSLQRQLDITEEEIAPEFDAIEEDLQILLSNMQGPP
jgi:recombinational DNA repair protein (RecF pathway)